ncbi:hypothetical protein CDAR_65971 [Caerostris darwini]|uniref:Uncharacterized protein n=1 Tax=Caerostris darwini TaxID=1538125 RepID=A0AAV4UC32_9ARAC|nr:hypothetical protein CDAR_65971 [Caerostris darwini]
MLKVFRRNKTFLDLTITGGSRIGGGSGREDTSCVHELFFNKLLERVLCRNLFDWTSMERFLFRHLATCFFEGEEKSAIPASAVEKR